MSFHISASLVSPQMVFRGSTDLQTKTRGNISLSSIPNKFGKKKKSMSVQVSNSSHNVICGSANYIPNDMVTKMTLPFSYQKELNDISRWCEDLDFATKLPLAMNNLVECYSCMSGIYYEPQYALARSILTKVVALPSIIHDIYDFYGTMEELELFTDAIERWDVASLEQLPEYMHLTYATLLGVYIEMEENFKLQGKSHCISYAKQAMTNLVKVYFQEAKWFHQNYTPTMEDYLSDAIVTTGYALLATTSLTGSGEIVGESSFASVFKLN